MIATYITNSHHYYHKLDSKKKYYTLNYLTFKFRLIFLFSILFIQQSGHSEIKLVIQGEGELYFLNSQFYRDPSEVIINGVSQPSCNKSCQFASGLSNVTIKFDEPLESCERMFDWLHNIVEIDLSNFDASKVTNMYRMFSDCVNVEKIYLGNINTSLVQNMAELFNTCEKLTYIDNLNFDTSSVVTMRLMFSGCHSILSIVAEFNPQNVENMEYMFNC